MAQGKQQPKFERNPCKIATRQMTVKFAIFIQNFLFARGIVDQLS